MADLLFFTRAKAGRIQILAVLLGGLCLLDHGRISFRIGILPNARDLPRDFDAGLVGANREGVIRDYFPGDDRLRELAQDGELITIVAVEGREVVRQGDGGAAGRVGGDVAVVDVHHVGRLDERMRKEFVLRIERVIDPEVARAFEHIARDDQIAVDDGRTLEKSSRARALGLAENSSAAPRAPSPDGVPFSVEAEYSSAPKRVCLPKQTNAIRSGRLAVHPDEGPAINSRAGAGGVVTKSRPRSR